MNDRSLGASSLVIALAIPVFMLLFGVASATGLSQAAGDPARTALFFQDHPPLAAAIFLNSIVMHLAAIVLAVGLYLRLAAGNVAVAAIGAVLGIAWAVTDIAQSSVIYSATIAAPTADPATIDAVARGMQNAAHLGGGLWVLSIAAISGATFGRAHRTVGLIVGTVFALHPLVVPLMPAWWALEYLGLPIWFAWTAIALLRGVPTDRPAIGIAERAIG